MPRYGKLNAQGEIVEEVFSDSARPGYVELEPMAQLGDKLVAGRKVAAARVAAPEIEPEYDPASEIGQKIKAEKDKAKGGKK